MARFGETNAGSTSTTWGYRRVKIKPPDRATTDQSPGGRRLAVLPWRDRRKPLTIRIKYRGGEACWYEIEARGTTIRRPGYVALHDVLEEINQSARKPVTPSE